MNYSKMMMLILGDQLGPYHIVQICQSSIFVLVTGVSLIAKCSLHVVKQNVILIFKLLYLCFSFTFTSMCPVVYFAFIANQLIKHLRHDLNITSKYEEKRFVVSREKPKIIPISRSYNLLLLFRPSAYLQGILFGYELMALFWHLKMF